MHHRGALLIVILVGVFVLLTGLLLTGAAIAKQGGQSCAVPGGYATIQAAVNDPGCDLVKVGRGTFGENVVIGRSVTIAGQGAANTIVDGRGSGDVFKIQAMTDMTQTITVTVTISGLTLVNGEVGLVNKTSSSYPEPGNGTANLYVNVSHCVISDNSSFGIYNMPGMWGRTEVDIIDSAVTGNLGFGLANAPNTFATAELKVVNSTVGDNSGGGIVNWGCAKHLCTSALHISGSTVSGNSSSGIYTSDGAETTVTNSSISGNTADRGGGIYSCGSTTLSNSSISGNSAGTGGGIFIMGSEFPYGCHGTVDARNSIVANSENGGDCILEIVEEPWPAVFVDNGYNIVEDGTCIASPTSWSSDPLLGPLADNGGHTLTHALLLGSVAIDAGDKAACPEKDQRGYSRPADGDLDGTAVCDIGSFELRHLPYSFYLPTVISGA